MSYYVPNNDVALETAKLIGGKKITFLAPCQVRFLADLMVQLPEKSADIIYERARGVVWSDAYVAIQTERLKKALKEARELAGPIVFKLADMPLEKLIALDETGIEDNYSAIIERICRSETEKRLPDLDLAVLTEFTEFISNLSIECSRATLDSLRLLKRDAYTYEAARFQRALINDFKPRSWDEEQTSYLEAMKMIVRIALEDAKPDKHYTRVIEDNILYFYGCLSESKNKDVKAARTSQLFDELPIDANRWDIEWMLSRTVVNCEEHIPVMHPETREQLLHLGFREMSELRNEEYVEKHVQSEKLRQKIKQSLDYIFS